MDPDKSHPPSPIPVPEAPVPPGYNAPQNVSPASSTTPQQNNLSQTTKTGMFYGRLNRIGFLMSIVYILMFYLIPIVILLLLRGHAIGNIVAILFGIVGIALAIPVAISVGVRRWHDMDQSGFMMLLSLIPFVGFILLIIYLFVPGTKSANKYGEPDTGSYGMGKVLFGK